MPDVAPEFVKCRNSRDIESIRQIFMRHLMSEKYDCFSSGFPRESSARNVSFRYINKRNKSGPARSVKKLLFNGQGKGPLWVTKFLSINSPL